MMYLETATKTVMEETATSPLSCIHCNTVLSKEDAHNIIKEIEYEEYFKCSCGKGSSIEELDVFILPTSIHLLDKDVAKDNIWFHTTNRENWETKVKTAERVPYIHAGTFEAAMERHEDRKSTYGWIYELRMKPECELADDVYSDLNRWDDEVDEDGIFEPDDIHYDHPKDALRYVNKWESVGSISLLMDPRMMEVVAVHPIGIHPPTRAESKVLAKELFAANH